MLAMHVIVLSGMTTIFLVKSRASVFYRKGVIVFIAIISICKLAGSLINVN